MKVKFKVSQCDCSVCASMCKNPCVPIPEEAQELINRGHKDNLEIWTSYFWRIEDDISVVRPKQTETNGEKNCVYFNTATRKCLLHDLSIKPLEGRLASHEFIANYGLHEYVCSRWDSSLGRELVELIQEQERD